MRNTIKYFLVFIIASCSWFLQSCSVSQQISKQVHAVLLQDSITSTGHVGISIYEPETNRYWYNYNADKYFVPASNVKLFTLYAGMKLLGDSLIGLRYYDRGNGDIEIEPTGEPGFLHPGFVHQPVYDFLHSFPNHISIDASGWKDEHKGSGWAWDDYNEKYMAQKSAFPVYGNMARIFFKNDTLTSVPYINSSVSFHADNPVAMYQELPALHRLNLPAKFLIKRTDASRNSFGIYPSSENFTGTSVPLEINDDDAIRYLNDAVKPKFPITYRVRATTGRSGPTVIFSRPADSLFIPMMHNSDNFFAEQTLLMVSNELLGYMNTEAITDSLLKSVLKNVPQRPTWADGSGLSRYNLFTPQSFIYVLAQLKTDFGMERMQQILPTGGEGTLTNYYQADSGFIYAKTGSLTGHTALSGYLITRKNKLLLFSIIANNVQGRATPVRRAMERLIKSIRAAY